MQNTANRVPQNELELLRQDNAYLHQRIMQLQDMLLTMAHKIPDPPQAPQPQRKVIPFKPQHTA